MKTICRLPGFVKAGILLMLLCGPVFGQNLDSLKTEKPACRSLAQNMVALDKKQCYEGRHYQ